MSVRRRLLRLIAYTWAAPNTTLGAIAGLAMLLLGGQVRVVSGVAEFHGGLIGRYLASFRGGTRFGAITLGHVIVGIDEPCLCVLRDHEHAHVRQCERWGLFFLPAYGLSSLWESMHGRNAYWNNWFERQARAVEAATSLRRGGEFTGDIRAGATRPRIPAPGDVDNRMKRLELKFPPLLVVAVFAAAMVALARAFPVASVTLPLRIPAAIALALLGGAIAIAGVFAFRAHRTTVNPMRPESAAIVVTGGVYRFSRNPMYLGLLLALAGLAVYVSNALAMLLLPAFVACMNRLQIEPEERVLAARFGAQYASYRARVRRWI